MFDIGPLPFVTLGPWHLGPIPIQSFGVLVMIGVVLAYQLSVRRAKNLGLDPEKMRSLLSYLLYVGFVGAHVFDVLFYRPEELLKEPWMLLWLPGSMSSYGGIAGALIGMAFWRRKHRDLSLIAYADVAAFALPVGWFFGRVGCALAHDHPGALTNFPLAVDFGAHPPGGVRHDLGLYEAFWWIVILIVFWLLNRRLRSPGLYLAALPLSYAPIRFLLDFLRAPANDGGDARYFGITPAQYASTAAFVAGCALLAKWWKRNAGLSAKGPTTAPFAEPAIIASQK